MDAAAPLDQEFEFTDLDSVAPGDYYYVRVNQLDGGRAVEPVVGGRETPPARDRRRLRTVKTAT